MSESLSRRDFLARSALAAGALAAGCRRREPPPPPATAAPPVPPAGRPQADGLDPLPYAYDALEPVIDARTMEIHYSRHHAGYASNYHAAVEGTRWEEMPLESVLADLHAVPEDIRTVARNHGGGLFNHTLFWAVMAPPAERTPGPLVARAIGEAFGSFDVFQAAFRHAALGQFGSGWAWLMVNDERELEVTSTPNQDNPLMSGVAERTGIPVLGLDVWEHAYYLHYQNRRADYADAWWRVVNWPEVERRYATAVQAPMV